MTLTGLANGTDYAFKVRAVSAAGAGAESVEAAATPRANRAPSFRSGAAFSVVENTTAVGTVTAVDADAGDEVTYAVTGGADESKFTIDGAGALAFAAAPDYEAPQDVASTAPASAAGDNEYIVEVTATGGAGLRARTARQTVRVRVTDADEIAPALEGANVVWDLLTLSYGELLDAASVPGAGAFEVDVGNAPRAVDGVEVRGNAVVLTLASAAAAGEAVTVSYTAPAGSGAKPVRDGGGNPVAQLTDHAVTNATPRVTLVLAPVSIDESGTTNRATVTATVSPAVDAAFTVEVSAAAVAPAVAGDFSLSAGTTLSFLSGAASSTGTVTVTAVDNPVDAAADGQVTVSGSVSAGAEVTGPEDVILTIADDDRAPGAPASLSAEADDAQVRLAWTVPADPGTSPLTGYQYQRKDGAAAYGAWQDIADSAPGEDNAQSLTLTGLANGTDYAFKVRAVSAAGAGAESVEAVATLRANRAPSFTSPAAFSVVENTTAVGTVTAVDADAGDEVTYAVTGGADASKFTIDGAGALAFAAAPDYEAPQDVASTTPASAAGDNEYIVEVTATGGTGLRALAAVQVVAVTVTDVADETAPVLEDAKVVWDELTLTYDEALDEGSVPGATAFEVTVEGAVRAVSGVEVTGRTVVLALGHPVAAGETVKVSYEAPAGPGAKPVRDEAGNPAAQLTDHAVTNETPGVTLVLTPVSIDESGTTNRATVTATVSPAADAAFTVEVSAAAVAPAVGDDFTLSAGTTLSFLSGAASSTGTVTVTAVDNPVDAAADGRVTVSGRLSTGAEVTGPEDLILTIADDDRAPGAPASLSAEAGDAKVRLAWTAPADPGTSPLTGYQYRRKDGAAAYRAWQDIADSAPGEDNAQSVLLTGLANGTDYAFKVRAVSAAGAGAESAEAAATPGANRAPSFTSAAAFSVVENTTAVGTVTAVDADAGDEVTYAVTGGADESKFTIDGAGALAFAAAPDFEAPQDVASTTPASAAGDNEYIVEVTATGGTGLRALAAVQTVTVTVTDADEAGPDLLAGAAGAKVVWDELTLTYDEALDEGSVPGAGAFEVDVGGTAQAPAGVDVTGATVVLTLASAVAAGETVTVTYEAPAGPGAKPVRDEAGNPAAQLTDHAVTNATPRVTLVLTPVSIDESGGTNQAAVTATVSPAADAAFTVEVSAAAVAPAVAGDVSLSAGTTLSFLSGAILSTGTVTVTAVDNPVDAADKSVTVSGSVSAGAEVTGPEDRTLTIADDDEAPAKPTGLSADPGDAMVTLAWTAGSAGTSGIEKHQYQQKEGAAAYGGWQDIADSAPGEDNATSVTVTGLVNETEYAFRVRAVSAAGVGAASNEVSATPEERDTVSPRVTGAEVVWDELTLAYNEALDEASVPGAGAFEVDVGGTARAPAGVDVTGATVVLTLASAVAAGETVTVTYEAPAGSGAKPVRDEAGNPAGDLTDYAVANATPRVTLVLAPVSIDESGGTNRATVTATVSPSADAAFTVEVSAAAVAPAVAEDFSLSSGTTLSFLSGAASSTGTVTVTAVDNPVDAADKSVTVSGSVSAGAEVTGPEDRTLTITDDDRAPGAPASLSTEAGDAKVKLAWAAPADTGTRPLTGYQYRRKEGAAAYGGWQDIADSAPGEDNAESVLLTGLANGTDYAFKVRAVSAAGAGAESVEAVATPRANRAPSFTSPAAFSVVENATAVGTVTAVDPDGGDVVTYAVTGGADMSKLTIDGAGALAFRTAPDFEAPQDVASTTPASAAGDNEYIVEVTATGGTGLRALAAVQVVAVTVTDGDEVVPALTGAEVVWDELTLTYDEALDEGSVPGAGAFEVDVANVARGVDGVTVTGATVVLTLASAAAAGETVTVTYTPPAGSLATPVQDVAGNDAAALASRAVTNATPRVTLVLTPVSIDESGASNRATVTATVSPVADAAFTVEVSAAAVAPAVAGDFSLSAGTTLSLLSGAASSTGTVTITAVDNPVDAADRSVTVSGSLSAGAEVTGPEDRTLTIADDDRAPGAPASLSAEEGDTKVRLAWTVPADTGTSPLTGYQYQQREQGAVGIAAWQDIAGSEPGGAHATSVTLTGLVNDTPYIFKVRAVSAAGHRHGIGGGDGDAGGGQGPRQPADRQAGDRRHRDGGTDPDGGQGDDRRRGRPAGGGGVHLAVGAGGRQHGRPRSSARPRRPTRWSTRIGARRSG